MSKEKPILFNAEMVQAVMARIKTNTRRVMKFQPCDVENTTTASGLPHQILRCYNPPEKFKGCASGWSLDCLGPFTNPYGKIGDRLWVKENYRLSRTFNSRKPSDLHEGAILGYEARGGNIYPYRDTPLDLGKLRPSIFMMRWMSRILLEITDVSVERVQDISEDDAWRIL